MLKIDIICLIVLGVVLLFGTVFGFGKGLHFISHGWTGRIISIVICYFIFGLVLNLEVVQGLLGKFVAVLDETKWYLRLLKTIRVDLVVFAIALFIVVQIVRKLFFGVIERIFEMDNPVMKVINKVLGVALFFALAVMIMLIILQILAVSGGATVDNAVYQDLSGSLFGIDKLFLNNPLNMIIESIKGGAAVQ